MTQREPFAGGIGQLGLLTGGYSERTWFGTREGDDEAEGLSSEI